MKLTDIAFLIPLYVEHEDRLSNLKYSLATLYGQGFTNIFIKEYYVDHPKFEDIGVPVKYFSEELRDDNFNKMKCVNELSELTDSDYISIYDVDVIIPKSQMMEAFELFENGADVVYPYDGLFLSVPTRHLQSFRETKTINFEDCEMANPNSYGGCVIYRRDIFEEGGRCNPNFKNVGFDDNELFVRFQRLGYNIKRTSGPLLHMEHYRSETSVEHSVFLNHNIQIYNHICQTPIDNLREEIKSWK